MIKSDGEYRASSIDTTNGYPLGTRVIVKHSDGKSYEGIVIGEKEVQDTNKFNEIDVYQIEYEDPFSEEEVRASWVVQLYANDIEGVFDLKQAYEDCDINIIDLKL